MPQDPYAAIAKPERSVDPYAQLATDYSDDAATKSPYGNVDSSNTIIGGALRRGVQTAKGIYHTVTDPPGTPQEEKESQGLLGQVDVVTHRVGRGIAAGEKEAAKQTKEQFKSAAATKGDPVAKGLKYAQAGVTAASMADPFATGPVTNINKLSDEGRYREAIGAGAFDALTLLVGRKTGEKVTPEKQLNKLAHATGATESIRPLDHIRPDIVETVAKTGKPRTVGQLETVIQDTMTRLDQKFNAGLASTRGQIMPTDIADALESKARTLPPTREGQAIARKLRSAATEYRRPWTPQELNSERMFRNGMTKGFEAKAGASKMAAMRTNAETMIDKIVADSSRDVLYDEMERQHPGQGFRALKSKQSSILEMQDKFRDHVEKLEAAQAHKQGAPLREKITTTANVHPGGVTPRLHGLMNAIPGGGPLKSANASVRAAFGPTGSATARRAAILSLPVSSIGQVRGATVPPPPSTEDSEGPQEQ